MLAKQLVKWQPRQSRRLTEEHLNAAMILMEIELEEVRGELEKLYSQDNRGRKGYDPVCVLRALLLMMILQYERISKFAEQLYDKPRLAMIAGFEPKKTPATSTFYLFIDRLEDGEHQKSCEHRLKPSKKRKKKHIRNLSVEKENKEARKKQIEKESDSVTIHLKKELLAKKTEPRVKGLQKLLEDLLMKLAIIPSANKGLLGELNKLKVCGDGSALESGANCNGQPTCDCRSKGIYKCKCDRIYSDPTANWGFDPYRQIYYFGHTFYQHTVSVSGHDLPLHITMGPASESDFTLSMKSLDSMLKMFSAHVLPVNIYSMSYDSGHDGLGIYQYLKANNIKPVIALNPRSGTLPKPTGTADIVNEKGVPLCPAGLEMRHNGKRGDGRIYYNCPVKRPVYINRKAVFKTHPQECPQGSLCQPDTQMGPVVYIRSSDDLRLYPDISRHSPEYKLLMNLRTGCERSNSTKKVVHKLANRPCRSATHFLVRLYLVAILEHSKAWLAERKKTVGSDPLKLIASFLAA